MLKGPIVNHKTQRGWPEQILAISTGSAVGSGVALMVVVMRGAAMVVVAVMLAEMRKAVEDIVVGVQGVFS